MKPLRIGILTDGIVERDAGAAAEIANGGVGVYIHNLVAALRRVDRVNQYVTIRCGGGRLALYAGGEHVGLPHSTWNRVVRWFDVPYARLVDQLRLDLLHYPNQFGGGFLPARIKRVMTLHDVTPLLYPRHHPRRSVVGYRLLMHRALRAADHVIVDAGCTAADLRACGAAIDGKLSVIPLGVAGHFRPDVRSDGFAARYGLPQRYILTVGVLEPRKNHFGLLRAVQQLHARGERVDVVIVGRHGWRWRDPRADPALASLRDRIHIHHHVPDADLPELYCRAALFAYPSFHEGFGLPVAEAMACGTPVVASHGSSLTEVAGDAALLADPHDPGDLAARLLELLRDAELRQRLRAAGLRRAAALTWQRTAERTREVYERVCCDRGGTSRAGA